MWELRSRNHDGRCFLRELRQAYGAADGTRAGERCRSLRWLAAEFGGGAMYLAGFITGLLFLVLEPHKHDRFVRFHAFQSIFLNAAWVAVYIGISIVTAILPGALWSISLMLHSLLSLAVLLLWLFLMYKAYQGLSFKLPLIGDIAERQAYQASPAR